MGQSAAILEEQGYDPATILAAALLRLGEEWANDVRPVCPVCSVRRVTPGVSGMCSYCQAARDRQLQAKRQWWHTAGNQWRREWKERTGRPHKDLDAIAGPTDAELRAIEKARKSRD